MCDVTCSLPISYLIKTATTRQRDGNDSTLYRKKIKKYITDKKYFAYEIVVCSWYAHREIKKKRFSIILISNRSLATKRKRTIRIIPKMSAFCVDFLVFSSSRVTPNTLLERDTKKYRAFLWAYIIEVQRSNPKCQKWVGAKFIKTKWLWKRFYLV